MTARSGSSYPRFGILLEREAELTALDEAQRSARDGRGGVVVVEGPAGIGKSALLARAAALAEDRAQVIAAAGRELEREFPFGVALQLFEPVLAGLDAAARADALAGAAELAAPLLTGSTLAARPPEGDAEFPFVHGLYWLVANLAEREPVVLTVDDAHWADRSSLRWLAYLARRVHELPIAVVLGIRSSEPEAHHGPLEAFRDLPGARLLRPPPLSPAATRRLVQDALPHVADPALVQACHGATGGNPFLLVEVLEGLVAAQGEGAEVSAASVRTLAPESISRSVLHRLDLLSEPAQRVARSLAVLGRGSLRAVGALANLPPEDAARATDELMAAQIVLDATQPEFSHPILHTAVYAELPAAERGLAHGKAARHLAEAGAAAEAVAAHLLVTPPAGDPWVVDALRSGAARALSTGAAETAARYLRRALAEPPLPAVRPEVLLMLGKAEARAADARGAERFQEALKLIDDPVRRARATLELWEAVHAAPGRMRELLPLYDDALELLGDADEELALRLEGTALVLARLARMPSHEGRARLHRIRGRLRDGTPVPPAVLAHVAYHRALSCSPVQEVGPLARRALDGGRLLAGADEDPLALTLAVGALMYADELDFADAHLETAIERARRHGSLGTYCVLGTLRAGVALRRGRLVEAAGHAHDALDAALGHDLVAEPIALACVAEVRLEEGRLEEAVALLGSEVEPRFRRTGMLQYLLATRGRVRLAQGRPRQALGDLLRGGELHEPWSRNPATMAWRSDAALAAVLTGDRGRALTLAAEEERLARAFGAPRARGIALRALGLVEGGELGLVRLREAVAVLAPSPARLEHARALVDLGAAQRRAGASRVARDPLREGLDVANRCGARGLAERARAELIAAGGRPRREALHGADALTSSERRITTLAAEGLTNREIAQALFVTTKTVEMHLNHAYRKLGIGSRGELEAALERPTA